MVLIPTTSANPCFFKNNFEKLHFAFLNLPLNNRILKLLLRVRHWLTSVSDQLNLIVNLTVTNFRVGTLIQFSNGFGYLAHELLLVT